MYVIIGIISGVILVTGIRIITNGTINIMEHYSKDEKTIRKTLKGLGPEFFYSRDSMCYKKYNDYE